jgi:hypothetical protein
METEWQGYLDHPTGAHDITNVGPEVVMELLSPRLCALV